ncbi:MAG: DNA primase catalytic subunit PriS [Thermoplasmata archaeon]|nr:DNA primase catalytic subunit PriS [Thermoplasmata archaeon]
MGKNVRLAPAELEFVAGRFAQYYRDHPLVPPPRLARREVAMFPFAASDLMRRHLAFPAPEELRAFLSRDPPRHLYYSTAYYRQPDASSMNAKQWLGADLVFDLDADHLRQVEGLDYPAQLERVRARFRTLLDDFLFGDFGIDPASTQLVFSGNRGYHAHIRSEAVLTLTSAERRELVEYILGIGTQPQSAVGPPTSMGAEAIVEHGAASSAGGRRQSRAIARPFVHLAPTDAPGWQGRTSRAVLQLLERWEELGAVEATREMERAGLEHPRASKLAHQLLSKNHPRMIREHRSLDVFPRLVSEQLLEVVLKIAAVEVQGETDAPVTTDIHRLIRWPGSLHGGSGLRVVSLEREELDRFDPLRDAVVEADGAAPVRVELSSAVHLPFGQGRIEGAAGDRLELSAPAAVFLVLRGEATLAAPVPA